MIRAIIVILTFAASSPCNLFADESISENAVPDVVLESWHQRWSESVVKMTNIMGDVLGHERYSDIDNESKAAALNEFNLALEHHISWERMGADLVRLNLLRSCGENLLNEVAPYFSDRDRASKIPDALYEQYEICWIDVDLLVSTSPAYATMEFSKNHLAQILTRHGIDPNGK